MFFALILFLGSAICQGATASENDDRTWTCDIDHRPSDGHDIRFVIAPSHDGLYRASVTVTYGGGYTGSRPNDFTVMIYDSLKCHWVDQNPNLIWCSALDANGSFYRLATTKIEETFIDSYTGKLVTTQKAKILLDSPEIERRQLFNAEYGKSGMLFFDLDDLKNCGFEPAFFSPSSRGPL